MCVCFRASGREWVGEDEWKIASERVHAREREREREREKERGRERERERDRERTRLCNNAQSVRAEIEGSCAKDRER